MILFILVLSVYILWKTKRFVAARYNAVHFLYGKFYQKWWWTILDDLYLKVITSGWALLKNILFAEKKHTQFIVITILRENRWPYIMYTIYWEG